MSEERIIKSHYHHIDNGGVTFSVIDRGVKNGGLVLRMEANYYGYPGMMSEMPIEHDLGSAWLEKIGTMFIAAADSIRDIDFSKRYE